MSRTEDRLDLEIALRQALSPRVIRDVSRVEGEKPFSLVDRAGAHLLRQATNEVAVGGSETIYLTHNGQARGDGIFMGMPSVRVYRDEDNGRGGLVRANGPRSAKNRVRLCPHMAFRLEWDPTDTVWVVTVTNNTEIATGFIVESEGV